MFTRPLKGLATMLAGAVLVILAQRAYTPAVAQGAGCGVSAATACELTGYKLLANKNQRGVVMLEIETRAGQRFFLASPTVMKRFADDLLESIKKLGAETL